MNIYAIEALEQRLRHVHRALEQGEDDVVCAKKERERAEASVDRTVTYVRNVKIEIADIEAALLKLVQEDS